jgi:hypothetical protein
LIFLTRVERSKGENMLELLTEDIGITQKTNIIYNDSSKLGHDLFSDLVSNEYLFNSYYANKKIDVTETWPDDSDYSFYPHIDDIAEDLIKNPKKYKDITVRVPSNYVYSSSSRRGGFDRTEDLLTNGGYETSTSTLRIKNQFGQERGFVSADCPTMNGFIRWHYKGKKIVGFTIVKNMGNHRFVMKKRANGGKVTEYLIKLHPHDSSEIQTLNELICRESDSHHTDGQQQRGQTEDQKAYSGFMAKKQEYIELVNFLKELQIDYSNLLKRQNLLVDPENTPSITSISHFNGGINSGAFAKYGYNNVHLAFETAKEIALHDEQKESLLSISHSAVMCFCNLFYYFASEIGDQDSLMTKQQLKYFIITTFTTKRSSWSPVMQLKELSQSGSQKDYNVINAIKFLRELNEFYIERVPTKIGKRRKNGFGMTNIAIKSFFNSISDPLQRNYAISESKMSF